MLVIAGGILLAIFSLVVGAGILFVAFFYFFRGVGFAILALEWLREKLK